MDYSWWRNLLIALPIVGIINFLQSRCRQVKKAIGIRVRHFQLFLLLQWIFYLLISLLPRCNIHNLLTDWELLFFDCWDYICRSQLGLKVFFRWCLHQNFWHRFRSKHFHFFPCINFHGILQLLLLFMVWFYKGYMIVVLWSDVGFIDTAKGYFV